MWARREPKNKAKKVYLRNHNRCFFHVFAQTTHVVTAPHGFACVCIPATRLYIPSFIEIRSGVSEPQGVKIWPFPLLWWLLQQLVLPYKPLNLDTTRLHNYITTYRCIIWLRHIVTSRCQQQMSASPRTQHPAPAPMGWNLGMKGKIWEREWNEGKLKFHQPRMKCQHLGFALVLMSTSEHHTWISHEQTCILCIMSHLQACIVCILLFNDHIWFQKLPTACYLFQDSSKTCLETTPASKTKTLPITTIEIGSANISPVHIANSTATQMTQRCLTFLQRDHMTLSKWYSVYVKCCWDNFEANQPSVADLRIYGFWCAGQDFQTVLPGVITVRWQF